jgi:hypothetical protein
MTGHALVLKVLSSSSSGHVARLHLSGQFFISSAACVFIIIAM